MEPISLNQDSHDIASPTSPTSPLSDEEGKLSILFLLVRLDSVFQKFDFVLVYSFRLTLLAISNQFLFISFFSFMHDFLFVLFLFLLLSFLFVRVNH